jgi:hypothetical protein
MTTRRRFSESYINRLLDSDERTLADLTSIIGSSSRYDRQAPDHGLPQFAFAFTEGLLWLAQAIRSGAWTYYEATPIERQRAALNAFRSCLRPDIVDCYERGMRDWQDESLMEPVGRWIRAHEDDIDRELRRLLLDNRAEVLELSA